MPKTQLKSDARPPQQKSLTLPKPMRTFLWLLASALLLTLIFPPFYCAFLAPIALVPFVMCILRRPMRLPYIVAYYAFGALYFLPNLFWIAPVTIGGYIALALFVALYMPLFALVLHRLIIHLRLPATLAVPLVWTAVEFIRAVFLMGGFPWFLLGNCLAPLPNSAWALTGVFAQSADLFGVWGLSCFLAMLNGFVVDVIRLRLRPPQAKGKLNPALIRLGMVAAGFFLANLAYGLFRLAQNTITPGPRVAVIQANFPQRVKDNPDMADEVLTTHVKLALAAGHANPKPDLVAWPETMVTTSINDTFLNAPTSAFKDFSMSEDTAQKLQAFSKYVRNGLQDICNDTDTAQLLGYGALEPRGNFNDSIKQNRTALIIPGGHGLIQEYAKIHLVPFGEFIPFRSVPLVKKLMLWMTPYGYDYSNTPGENWTRFTLNVPVGPPGNERSQLKTYTFATPICFEDAMPEPARKMTMPQFGNGQQKTDFLVNVSNDGWFYGTELDQHIQACQLRAIENRVPIARSVNTGNSGFIDSNGRITLLVTGDDHRTSLEAVGTASQVMPLDSRVTLYSRIGDLLPIVCGILSALLTGWTFVRPRR